MARKLRSKADQIVYQTREIRKHANRRATEIGKIQRHARILRRIEKGK